MLRQVIRMKNRSQAEAGVAKSLIKDDYQVVVVGAGPAGLHTSKKLAEAGLDVLCVDKKPEIGTPKRCAEGLSRSAFRKFNFDEDAAWVRQEIDGAYCYAPNGDHVYVGSEAPGYVLERKLWEKDLAQRASQAGAKVVANTNVLDLRKEDKAGDETITGVSLRRGNQFGNVSCDLVVGADGIDSKVGKMAGLSTFSALNDVDSGFQYEMSNIELKDPRHLELYFGTEIAPRGYIWVFPKGEDVANVGIGIGGNEDKSAKFYLDQWLQQNTDRFSNSSIIEENSGGIPVGGFLDEMVADRLVLVGDAARQVNPIHGGGMHEGMVAAELAADRIVEAFDSQNFSQEFLESYERAWWEERGEKLQKIEKLRKAIEQLEDEHFNYLASELTGDDLTAFARGEKLGYLGKILVKNLGLRRAAKFLLSLH